MSCLTVFFFFRFEKAEFGDIGMIPPHEDHCTELDPGCSSGGATISERTEPEAFWKTQQTFLLQYMEVS